MMDYTKLYGQEVDESGSVIDKKKVVPKAADVVLPALPDSTDIRDRCKAVEDKIFEGYYKLAFGDDTPPAIRKSSLDAMADRARGKPAQSMEIQGKIQFEQLVIMRTPKQVETLPVKDGIVVE